MTIQRVLVTGVSGFVGRPLVAELLRAGYAVRAATRRPVSLPEVVETAIIPDLKKSIDWVPILQGIDSVIHLAGKAHVHTPNADYTDYELINEIATRQLALAAKSAGVARLIYISSVRAQTGASAAVPLTEQDRPRPTNPYGRSKLAAETAIRESGVPYTIFRPVVIYGPNPKGNVLTLVRLAKLPLPLPTLAGRRSLLGIDNFISAIIFALKTPATVNETYLVADKVPMTVDKILSILRRAQGRSVLTLPLPRVFVRILLAMSSRSDLWSRVAESMIVDTSKLKSLGWRPPIDTPEGLRAMLLTGDDGSEAPMRVT